MTRLVFACLARPMIVLCGLTVLLVPTTPAAASEIYKYIDAEGVLFFTDRPIRNVRYVPLDQPQGIGSGYDTDRYDPWIRQAARTYGVSFALIKAVIKVESDFNPSAVSTAGARGLMQIMPLNDSSLDITNPFHPGQNIMGGTLYLRRMLDRYNGNLRFALAAYNAGPRTVDRYGRIPPYPETVNYVRKVITYYTAYR